LLRPAENATAAPHRARFRRWDVCGERSDYADVVIEPPLDPTESGVRETLTPRNPGTASPESLAQVMTRFPADVYVTTVPQVLLDAARVQPDALKIRIWAVLEGAIHEV
jgi:hypothetical protein